VKGQLYHVLFRGDEGREIFTGELLDLGYSSENRSAYMIRKMIQKDRALKKKFKDIKSIIKI